MPDSPIAGEPFGNYEVVSLLGRGAMGQVFRAFERSTGRHVALETIRGVPYFVAENAAG